MLSANLNNLGIVPYIAPKLAGYIEDAKKLLNGNPESGRHDIDGDKAFVLVVDAETEELAKRRPEFHNNYLDVQILIEGSEVLGYGHMPHGEVSEDLMADKDVAFTAAIEDEKFIELAPLDFAVFYPGELHRPQVEGKTGAGKIKKAIVKIHREAL
ncbi:YhcH/YjgK/YiaL family protein [Polycladidibacter stylochi]|uniref:YhcH/YjgK/YiaL family protein n=1 Tax=Polycladidibacter stylochi TaxID=1807766 RepID=UPI00082E2DFE|nr:YhcH/YjgK/YiaL family protein [Pseudovibrio stylochi]